ncbi:hypothetical protein PV682_12530 [Streptomyces niveiscabiei]|uniref:hypothetical protein n=1 Tax=Streptomyces niveiscabiei TaxID=164115 RepID=UPI0029A71059|nr:hypothetical protein [Streptomyces niveiscabiei]MDX3382278.1 hypothetical protein [Streptomyces niveiscabiei]
MPRRPRRQRGRPRSGPHRRPRGSLVAKDVRLFAEIADRAGARDGAVLRKAALAVLAALAALAAMGR